MRLKSKMEGMLLGMTMALGILAGVPAQADGPAPVDLGSAGGYVILSKTGISTTGVTSIVGYMGVSPIAATAITGFDLILSPTGRFSTSALVEGRVFASNYADPTPARMTAAVGAMETAYLDAKDRTLPDFTELYGGDLTGQTLAPGLYKWGSGVLISAGGVTLSGSPTDVSDLSDCAEPDRRSGWHRDFDRWCEPGQHLLAGRRRDHARDDDSHEGNRPVRDDRSR